MWKTECVSGMNALIIECYDFVKILLSKLTIILLSQGMQGISCMHAYKQYRQLGYVN